MKKIVVFAAAVILAFLIVGCQPANKPVQSIAVMQTAGVLPGIPSNAPATLKPTVVPESTQKIKPSPTPAVTATPGFTLGIIVRPTFSIIKPIKSEIEGKWYCVQLAETTVEYKADKTFIVTFKSGGYYDGTYTYDAAANKGVMTEGGSGSQDFTFNEVKKQIHFYYNGQYLTFIDQAP